MQLICQVYYCLANPMILRNEGGGGIQFWPQERKAGGHGNVDASTISGSSAAPHASSAQGRARGAEPPSIWPEGGQGRLCESRS